MTSPPIPSTCPDVPVEFFEGGGKRLAFRRWKSRANRGVGVLFLNGLSLDMEWRLAREIIIDSKLHNLSAVAFDHHGAGKSSRFQTHRESFKSWLDDALLILDRVCGPERQIVVGFFTGAWVAIHVALQRPMRVKALMLVSPGVDITNYWWQSLSPEDQERCRDLQKIPLPPAYAKDVGCLPLSFVKEAEEFLLLQQPSIKLDLPVRIYQGLKDNVVPAMISRDLMEKISSDDIHLTLIKEGDHCLSRMEQRYIVLQGVDDMANY